MMRNLFCLGLLVAFTSCAGGKAERSREPKGAASPDTLPLEVTAAKAKYYTRALPAAESFVGRRIPKSLIKTANKGNDVYVEARDAAGRVVGYVRDFVGPVSLNESCACSPLNLTLVFDREKKFSNLIAPGPIYKWGEQPMSKAEIDRLISIIKAPHPSIINASGPETMVDIKSGATKKEYSPHVVSRAALSSQRLARLAKDTEVLLERAPMKRDQKKLEELVNSDMSVSQYVEALAGFIGESESPELREQAYREMAYRYPDVAEKSPSKSVESVLLNAAVDRELRVSGCYLLAERALRNAVTEDCASRTSATSDQPLEARLAGTVAFNRGDFGEATRSLEQASNRINHISDPGMHLRLGASAQKTGDAALACSVGKKLYQDAPLFPGVEALLKSCAYRKGVAALKSEIQAIRRQRVLNGEHPSPAKVPTLSLETEKFEPLETTLASDGRVTVAVFFATWCPHCQRELPKLVEFQRTIETDPTLKGKVRVVAVRTLIERETEQYAAFKKRFGINFPVYTDPAMGTALASFARSQGIDQPGVPLVALIDDEADVRYILQSHEYSDTIRELRWLLDAIRG